MLAISEWLRSAGRLRAETVTAEFAQQLAGSARADNRLASGGCLHVALELCATQILAAIPVRAALDGFEDVGFVI
jgi:hypothetical protein